MKGVWNIGLVVNVSTFQCSMPHGGRRQEGDAKPSILARGTHGCVDSYSLVDTPVLEMETSNSSEQLCQRNTGRIIHYPDA